MAEWGGLENRCALAYPGFESLSLRQTPVFHSLRHTMVTLLKKAGVPERLYQEIVGYERQGVSQQVYFQEGHELVQK